MRFLYVNTNENIPKKGSLINKHTTSFILDQETKVVILLQDPIEWLGPIYEEDIIFTNSKDNILLAYGPIYYNMQQLETFLKSALANDLQLDPSITADIGYLCNEYSYKFTLDISSNEYIDWIGDKYHVWEAASDNSRFIAWIYTDNDTNIIFEITPFYPYMHCDPEEEPNYVPYEEWKKTYTPYLKTILPRETAQEWLKQAEFIIKIIEDNETEWQKKRKEQ